VRQPIPRSLTQWTASHVVFILRHVPIPGENAALQLCIFFTKFVILFTKFVILFTKFVILFTKFVILFTKFVILFTKGFRLLGKCSLPLLVILLQPLNDLLQLRDDRLS
jgi:hypothetical protein